MIATNICVLGICFLLLLYWYFPIIRQYKHNVAQDSNVYTLSYKQIILILITFLFFTIIFNIPIIDGGGGGATSAINLLYSYCDSPSFLAILLVFTICLKQVLRLVYLYSHNMLIYRAVSLCELFRFNGYCALILFIYGCILYGGSLGMLTFDIYHLEILWQGIIGFLLLILLYVFNPQTAYLGLFALLIFYIFGYENMSVLESFICPYLWVYCAFYMIYTGCKFLCNIVKLKYKNSISKGD